MGMSKDNPAVFQCEKSESTLHRWRMMADGKRARCMHCRLVLTEAQTREVYEP